VYAVPQVLAATLPVSATAGAMATLVKLTRVLMLGPVILVLALIGESQRAACDDGTARARPKVSQIVPWFIIGFVVLVLARSAGAIPKPWLAPIGEVSTAMTIVSMAALILGVDVRTVAQAGTRVIVTVTGSLLLIGAIAVVMIRALGV